MSWQDDWSRRERANRRFDLILNACIAAVIAAILICAAILVVRDITGEHEPRINSLGDCVDAGGSVQYDRWGNYAGCILPRGQR